MAMRCGHCGTEIEETVETVETVGAGEQYCARCQVVLRKAAERAAAEAAADEKSSKRIGWVMGLVGAGAGVGAFGMTGFFGEPNSLVFCYAAAVLGGVLGGLVAGRSWTERLVQVPLGALAGVGALLATAWYIEDRSRLINLELLLPIGLGGLPGWVAMIVAAVIFKRRRV